MVRESTRQRSGKSKPPRTSLDDAATIADEILNDFKSGWDAEILVGRPPFPNSNPWHRPAVYRIFHKLITNSIRRNSLLIKWPDQGIKDQAYLHGGLSRRTAYALKLPALDLETLLDTLDSVKVNCPIVSRGKVKILGLACDF